MDKTDLPELPESEYLLARPARPYENEYITSFDGYSDDDMRSYALTAIVAERARADALQEKFDCADLMAQCMAGLREDCIKAGVVDESVPPMMYPEEIIPRLARADALEAALDNLVRAYDDMWLGQISLFSDDWDQVQGALDAQFDGRLLEARALLNQKD